MALGALVRRGISSSSASTFLARNSRSSVTIPLADKLNFLAKLFSTKPTGNEVVGMDFGSTNSHVSVMGGKSPKVINNVDGNQRTPSVIAFNQKRELLFGTPAMRHAMTNPTNTVFGTKNLIHRCFHASVQRQAAKEAEGMLDLARTTKHFTSCPLILLFMRRSSVRPFQFPIESPELH